VICSFLLALFVAASAVAAPNILVILADDVGWGDPGCYGATKVKTPRIDRLAQEGVRFTDAHSPSAVCSPTRYGLLTGRYAWRTRLKSDVLHADDPLLIERGRLTLPAMLKRHGYATAGIGKWHLGLGDPKPDWNGELKPGPLEAGFDYFFGLPTVASEEPRVFFENHRIWKLDPADPITELTNKKMTGGKAARYEQERIDDVHSGKAIAWLRAHAQRQPGQPFFLYYASSAAHDPFVARPQFRGGSEAGERGDFVQDHDDNVGRLLDALDALKLAADTLVIYTSDNGALERHLSYTPPEGIIARYGHKPDGDWRGQKTDIWEGGHRVPFIARWPGRITPGTTSDEMICLTDLFATAAAIVGAQLAPGDAPDSVNVLPALLGEKRARPLRDTLVMHSIAGMFAIREGPWKLIPGQGSGGATSAGFRYGKQPPPDPSLPPGQLYDLANDPRETKNRYTEKPLVVERLSRKLEALRIRESP
jgi:arylsulfatase A-like enzyme